MTAPRMDGEVHPAYANPRAEVTVLVPTRCRRVLDVGCSTGVMGAALAARGHEVTGIELDPALAQEARTCLPKVLEDDVEALARAGADPGGPYDCVVLADVLEHLRDPWTVTRWAAGLLDDGGCLVISVPNVRHALTFWSLLRRRRWPYADIGIFDRTHLRFFARSNLPDLLDGTGLEITELQRSHALTVHRWESRWNRVARYLGDLGTLQFIFRAEAASGRAGRP